MSSYQDFKIILDRTRNARTFEAFQKNWNFRNKNTRLIGANSVILKFSISSILLLLKEGRWIELIISNKIYHVRPTIQCNLIKSLWFILFEALIIIVKKNSELVRKKVF